MGLIGKTNISKQLMPMHFCDRLYVWNWQSTDSLFQHLLSLVYGLKAASISVSHLLPCFAFDLQQFCVMYVWSVKTN